MIWAFVNHHLSAISPYSEWFNPTSIVYSIALWSTHIPLLFDEKLIHTDITLWDIPSLIMLTTKIISNILLYDTMIHLYYITLHLFYITLLSTVNFGQSNIQLFNILWGWPNSVNHELGLRIGEGIPHVDGATQLDIPADTPKGSNTDPRDVTQWGRRAHSPVPGGKCGFDVGFTCDLHGINMDWCGISWLLNGTSLDPIV